MCRFKESEDLTILICFYEQMWGLDNKMIEETRNKWTLSKEKIEWDAVETIPILLYTDNFTLLSVYKRGIKSNALYLRK